MFEARHKKSDWTNRIFYIIISLLVTGCNLNKSNQHHFIEENPNVTDLAIDPVKANSIDTKSLIKEVKLIKLEKKNESLIGMVNEVRIALNNIYLLDRLSASVYCFGMDGNFKFKIANQGRGPKEYIDAETFCIDEINKEIVLCERARKRVHRYDAMQGSFKDIIDLGIYVEQITKNKDRFFLVSDEYNKDKLQVYSSTMKKALLGYFPFDAKKNDYTPPQIISNFRGNILYTHPFADIIYQINEGSVKPIYNIDFGPYKIDPTFFKGDLSQIKQKENEFLTRKYASSIHFLLENEQYISFRYPHGKEFRQVFLVKENNNILNINQIKNQETGFILPFPVAAYENYFVSVIYPTDIEVDMNRGVRVLNDEIEQDGLLAELQHLKQDDNAAVLIYQIKMND